MITKPMLAVAATDLATLQYPLLATPKLDGIRCVKVGGKALSRKFKEIPNRHVRKMIETHCPDGFDGEIMCPGKTFNETQSLIMTEYGEPEFEYVVFDYVSVDLKEAYQDRMHALALYEIHCAANGKIVPTWIKPLFPTPIQNLEELKDYEEKQVANGYEGVMVRTPDSPYKCGRSTLKEGFLLKIKRFADAEAEVIGFEERLHNQNEATVNELGYTKRSSHKANLVPAGTLGTLLVRDLKTGIEFGIGTGFDDSTRLQIWNNKEEYLSKIVTYQYQPSGMKDKPRFPSFKGFRDPRDL